MNMQNNSMTDQNRGLRVAQVIAGAQYGGAENFYVRLVQGLHQSGQIEQKAFLRNHRHRFDALQEAGIQAMGFRFGGPLRILDRRRYVNSLTEYAPDIVMTWMNRASGMTPAGPYRLVCRLGHYYNLKYYRHADYWVGISRGICDHLVRGGMLAERVFHIPNFAEETEVAPVPRSSFNTSPDAPLLLAAGRLHVNKGFDTLFKALIDIPEAMLWLAGIGPEEASLKKLASDLGLSERVRFLGWRSDVPALMRSADLFVCPSRHEGLGSIVMESWAHSCPIVATASQGPGELISDGETGLLTPIDQPAPLGAAIRELLGNPQRRAALSEKARKHYWKRYSRQVIVQRYEELFRNIAEK